jgi:2-octaprenylphenol hydroxylase
VRPDFDLVVVGGGAVGATLAALAVQRAGLPAARVAVIEREIPPRWEPGGAYDLRVFALSRASARVLAAAGAWDAIESARVSPYECMRVWRGEADPRGADALVFDAAELAEPNLGHIVEHRLIQSALFAALERLGVERLTSELSDFTLQDSAVDLAVGPRRVSARLVVGADGGRSRVRDLAGLGATGRDYGQRALIAEVATARPHERTAWQRFLGHGTLAFLPLANGHSSIVWSLPEALARELEQTETSAFDAELTAALRGALGEARLVSRRVTVPLATQSAAQYVTERCALAGDAAHTVHPLAGQGVNLGLLDVAALADALAEAQADGEDCGALRILRRYERERRPANELMNAALDAMNGVLATGEGAFAEAAAQGLGFVNRIGPVKRFFAARALGTGGELPRAARRRGAGSTAGGAAGVSRAESGRSSPRR